MNKKLKEKTREWMQLERKTLEQRKEADRYYDMNLMGLIEEDFIKRNRPLVKEPIRNLVISVGTSYEPIVLSIALLKPEKVLFLYTDISEKTLDKVVDHTGLLPSGYEKSRVNEIDPIDIYREVKEAYLRWERPEKMYIDFTGGTKAMSAAAALAGAMINVQMIYVASDDYLADFRKPKPGSEKLVFIDNPLAVFGDLEVDNAIGLYEEHNFAGCCEKLSEIKESIPNPVTRQELCFYYLLSCAYEGWDSLDFERASSFMSELIRQIKRDGRNYPGNTLVVNGDILQMQESMLSVLAKIPGLVREKKQTVILRDSNMIVPLMFTMWMNAKTREEQNKYDMATLLLYRLLEMIEQRRLSQYGLFVSDVDYDRVAIDKDSLPEAAKMNVSDRKSWLRSEVYGIRKQLFKGYVSDHLPNPVSLLDGFVILSALHDPIVFNVEKDRLVILKQIRSKVHLRNNSIFAHGLGPVPKEDFVKFRDFVSGMFKVFCSIENIEQEKYEKIFRWIPLREEEVI